MDFYLRREGAVFSPPSPLRGGIEGGGAAAGVMLFGRNALEPRHPHPGPPLKGEGGQEPRLLCCVDKSSEGGGEHWPTGWTQRSAARPGGLRLVLLLVSRPWLRHGARCVPVPVVRQKWLRWVTPRPMLFRGLCEQGPSSAGSPCRSTGAASAPDPGAQIGSQIILFRRNWSDLQLTRHPRTDRSSRPRSMCGDGGYCAGGIGEGDKMCGFGHFGYGTGSQ